MAYGGNRTGVKWNKGGAKSRKNGINIDFNGFAEYAEILDELGANLQKVFTDAMQQAGETVADDTVSAVASANLPAGGKYSRGKTENAVIRMPVVEWQGGYGEMKLGFDYTKPGAGGFLITGTPKMRPDHALEEIYASRKYEKTIQKDIETELADLIEALGGAL